MTTNVKSDFSSFICSHYCVFFKEGEKEDMACGAAPAAMELIREGLVLIEDLPKSPSGLYLRDNDSLLYEIICRGCPFVLDGCDFRLADPPDDAVPCGGLILLALLLRSGAISSDSLRKVVHG